MRVVDTALFELMEANGFWVPELHAEDDPQPVPTPGSTFIYDGLVIADNTTDVVTYDLPYGVYYSSVGDDDLLRLSARKARRSIFFTLTYVGADRNQAKWAGEKLRLLLQGRRMVIPGHKSWLVDLQESQRVRRDDDAIRPDGSPLFYGVDNYAVSITQTPEF